MLDLTGENNETVSPLLFSLLFLFNEKEKQSFYLQSPVFFLFKVPIPG